MSLNRVSGSTPSRIAGQLNSNGQVYLINPHGIIVTPSGKLKQIHLLLLVLILIIKIFLTIILHSIKVPANKGVINSGKITLGSACQIFWKQYQE